MHKNKMGQKICTYGSNEMCRRRHKKEISLTRVVYRRRVLASRKG